VEGFEVLYLGTSIELDSLGSIFNIQDDDVLFFSVNAECTDDEINKVVPFLNENYQPSLKIISGINVPQKLETLKERLSNSRVVDSAGSFRKVVGSRKEDNARG
jgi:methanogenic corrinoid protein MtbC1